MRIGQGLANSDLQAESSQLVVFVNKMLLEHSHAHSLTYGPWLLSGYISNIEQMLLRLRPTELMLFTVCTILGNPLDWDAISFILSLKYSFRIV